MDDTLFRLIHGSAHQIDLPDQSVHCLVTSPPYFGLRAYAGEQDVEWPHVTYTPMPGLPASTIQGCEPDCEHEWAAGPLLAVGRNDGGRDIGGRGGNYKGDGPHKTSGTGAYCLHCGGWRGGLGAEPTIEAYIGHLVLCLRECHRILRDDGTAWVNLGDSYATHRNDHVGGGFGDNSIKAHSTIAKRGKFVPAGLKPKDLIMVPQRFALAAQADGWYVRSEMIWSKPNPMPESVTDRPTKAHEYIYLLTKKQRYFYDAAAAKEEPQRKADVNWKPADLEKYSCDQRLSEQGTYKDWRKYCPTDEVSARNLRTVLTIATQPTPFAHFATYSERIPEIAILAGTSARGVCPACGEPWVRVVEREAEPDGLRNRGHGAKMDFHTRQTGSGQKLQDWLNAHPSHTVGWQPSCECEMLAPDGSRVLVIPDPIPATVLDPFHGSGTTGVVALRLGRAYVGVDISAEYLDKITAERMKNGVQIGLAL